MPKSLYIDPVKVREPGYIHFEDIPVCQYNKTIKQELEEGNYTKEDLIRIYRDMAICREFEHMLTLIKTQANYNGVETTYPGPAHLSLGQEASCVGEAYLLTKDDITFGSHRSHSEILSKGLSCINKLSDEELMSTMENFLGGKTLAAVKKFADTSDVKELAIRFLLYGTVAEIFARENGFHHGMGGSMHAFFLPFGIYPNNAIVGGSAPIATGAALYQKNNDKKGVVVCNIGDASLGCGPVYEAMNFSAMDQFKTLWEEGRKGGLTSSSTSLTTSTAWAARPWARPWPTTCPPVSAPASLRARCTQSVSTAGTRWLSSTPTSVRWSSSRTTKAPSCSTS